MYVHVHEYSCAIQARVQANCLMFKDKSHYHVLYMLLFECRLWVRVDCNVLYTVVTRSRSPSPPRSSRVAHPPSPPRSSRTAQRRGRGPHLRSKSLTSQLDGGRVAPGDARYLALRLENTEKKLSDTQLLLHLKVRPMALTLTCIATCIRTVNLYLLYLTCNCSFSC